MSRVRRSSRWVAAVAVVVAAGVAGARDAKTHWAFVPPAPPALPDVSNPDWVRDPLDRFVLARLDAEGLAPAPEAERAALLRRVSFDLTGLPPTLAELDAFLADERADAYERAVDRLLASPRFGERMALHWLDLARYADTNGYSIDGGRHMWAWRDWVIDAFNANMPFDRFAVEQLAGDLLPDATLEQRIASGFNRNHMITHEGGTIEEEYRVAYVVDRVKTTGQAFMGLTLGCAQCHDHKFDPIDQEEFYEFSAYFNTITDRGNDGNGGINAEPSIPVPSRGQRAELAALRAELAALEAELLEASADGRQAEWERAVVAELEGIVEPTFGAWKVSGPWTAESGDEAFDAAFPPERGEDVDWLDGSAFTDGKAHALFDATNAASYLTRTVTVDSPTTIALSLGSDDAIKLWRDGELMLENRVQRGVAPDQERLELDLRAGANRLLLKIVNYGGPGGFYFATPPAGPSPEVRRILLKPAARRTAAEAEALAARYRAEASWFRPLRDRIAPVRERIAAIEAAAPTSVMVMEEMAEPRATYVLDRGQYDQPGARVRPDVPDCLPPLPPDAPPNRLGLARWLVDPAHPLTSRVAANSWWQMLFGTGLVETSEDFGTQGSPPSHPALLDHLAASLVESGWDVKAMLRRIVTSATYRQDSRADDAAWTRDPRNRLLARGPRFRLPAEMIRDQALFAGGLLVERVGGPSVKPYQPPGLWIEMSHFGSTPATEQVYEQGSGEDLWRRSLYTVHKRTVPPPAMAAFDQPNREICVSRRSRTNTPLQALVLLNDPTFVEAARALAERALTEGGATREERARFAYRLATSREPSSERLAVLVDAAAREARRFAEDPDAARALLEVGESPRDASLAPAEHAAWTVVASTILNLSETITRS